MSQIDIANDVELPLAIFVWNPPLLTLIVVIRKITNPFSDDFPIDNSTSVLPNTPHLPSYRYFGIPFGETPSETQTFLLTFLKRSHDLSPMTRYFRNGDCSFCCSKSLKFGHVWLYYCQRPCEGPIQTISIPFNRF